MIAIGGENLIDLVQTGAEDGPTLMRAIPGGSCYNCARAAARQGAAVVYLTPISTDPMGDLLTAQLLRDGVQTAARRVAAPTTLALVSIRDGQPAYAFYRSGTAERAVTPEGLRAIWPAAARIFHVGSLALIEGADADAWEGAFAQARAAGLLVTIDPNVRPMLISDMAAYRARIARMLRNADLVKLSDEDLGHLWPELDPQTAPEELAARSGAGLVVVTLGAEGAVASAGGRRLKVAATPVRPVIDTVGAGDTFMGTLLAGLDGAGVHDRARLDALPAAALGAILHRAGRAAALNCRSAGCNPPFAHELQTP